MGKKKCKKVVKRVSKLKDALATVASVLMMPLPLSNKGQKNLTSYMDGPYVQFLKKFYEKKTLAMLLSNTFMGHSWNFNVRILR